MTPTAETNAEKKKRIVKKLPLEFQNLTPRDLGRVVTREIVLASDIGTTFREGETRHEAVAIRGDDGTHDMDITTLNSDQLKDLCKVMGVKSSSGKTKAWCLLNIGQMAVRKSIMNECHNNINGHRNRKEHNSDSRSINVRFSDEFAHTDNSMSDPSSKASTRLDEVLERAAANLSTNWSIHDRVLKMKERKLLKEELKEIKETERDGSLSPPTEKLKRKLKRRLDQLADELFPRSEDDN
jgi:hypothetical protein